MWLGSIRWREVDKKISDLQVLPNFTRVLTWRGSAHQQNSLRQVMWVSNPLKGYRIPSSAVHSLSVLSKTLTGPRARACQARRQSDGEPPPWCTRPWLSLPLRLHTQGPTITATQPRCTGLWVCTGMNEPVVHEHVLLSKTKALG